MEPKTPSGQATPRSGKEIVENLRRLGVPVDDDEALALEFQEGHSKVSQAVARMPEEQRNRLRRSRKPGPEEVYCRTFLQSLDEQEAAARETGADLTQIRIARSAACVELSRLQVKATHFSEAEDLLHTALTQARQARHRRSVGRILIDLGLLHLHGTWVDRDATYLLDAAASFLKEALVYAESAGQYPDLPRAFYWLGVVLATREETLAQAVLAFDCCSRFGPAHQTAFVEMQQCRLRLGEREKLVALLKPRSGMDLHEALSAIAAAEVLKRPKRKLPLLKQAVEIAAASGEARWLRILQRQLDELTAMLDPASKVASSS